MAVDSGNYLSPRDLLTEVESACWLAMASLGGTDTTTFDWASNRRAIIGLAISEFRKQYVGKNSSQYDADRRDSERKKMTPGERWDAWKYEDPDYAVVNDTVFDFPMVLQTLEAKLPPTMFTALRMRYLDECDYPEFCRRYYGVKTPTTAQLASARQLVYAATKRAKEVLGV